MRNFEEKLKKMSSKRPIAAIVLFIVAAIFVLGGLTISSSSNNSEKTNENVEVFDGTYSSADYTSFEFYYLVGPFAEYAEGDKTITELYTAVGTDDLYYMVEIEANSDLPIYGVNVDEDDLEDLEPTTIYGKPTYLGSELAGYLAEFWNEIYEEEFITTSNYSDYFGSYYLDTTYVSDTDSDDGAIVMYVIAGIFGLIAIICFFTNMSSKKKSKEKYEELKNNPNYDDMANDYESDDLLEFKKLKMDIGNKYIFDYSKWLDVIPMQDIINAYRSNMINGVYQLFKYIAVETKDDDKYYFAQTALNSKLKDFDIALDKIKSNIKLGGF